MVDRAALFLHRAEATLPSQTRELLGHLRTGDAPLHGRKVLVIDDDIRNVFALTSTLEQRGMKVVFAENGREGIERLHQHPNTDVVLLDIMMPEMDGYETARGDPLDAALRAPADHLADRKGHEGRPGEGDRRGRFGLHHQARRRRSAAIDDARVAGRLDI